MDVKEMFISASKAYLHPFSRENDRQRLRENLLEILQNKEHRDILVECVNENVVVGAFIAAASHDDVDLLQAFCDIGINVNARNQAGVTALKEASIRGSEEAVRWLLERNTNVEIEDSGSYSPLIFSSMNGKTNIVEMLLQKNANPEFQGKGGMSALMFASLMGHQEVVQLLLHYNVDTDLKNKQGRTALDFAKNDEIKEMLLNRVTNSYVLK